MTATMDATLLDSLVALRRALHAEPELAFQEHRSAARLREALEALCGEALADVRVVAQTGLVARIRGRDGGAPVVALRGDIDALPIQEETGLPYASRTAGVMHACGHDVHASWAVGAAALLSRSPAAGDVLVVLQPAEEIGAGAAAVLESGALDEARAIFGAHVDRRFPVGQVVADEGPLAASTDTFTLELIGRGAHAARPHESSDPIVGGAAVVTALQTIVARRLNPAHAGVVTIGEFHAGSASNVIPECAKLGGTLRAVLPETRALLREGLQRVTQGVAAAHGLEAVLHFDQGTPPVINAAQPVAWAREAVTRELGAEALVPLGLLNMAGEDFAYYLERIPGAFLRIGAREPDGATIAAHSPHFAPAEESLAVGARVLAECARVASAALRGR